SRLDRLRPCAGGQKRQVVLGDVDRFGSVGKQCQPLIALSAEAQAEGVVLRADGGGRPPQEANVEIAWDRKKKCPAPVVLLTEFLLEEPMLNGREGDPAG